MPAFAGMTGGFKSSGRNRHSRASGNPAGVFGRRQWPGCGSAVRRVDFKLTHHQTSLSLDSPREVEIGKAKAVKLVSRCGVGPTKRILRRAICQSLK